MLAMGLAHFEVRTVVSTHAVMYLLDGHKKVSFYYLNIAGLYCVTLKVCSVHISTS